MLNACIICHKKKVKCDLARHRPCSNCTKAAVDCIPYTRKRKRWTNSLSPRESLTGLRTTKTVTTTSTAAATCSPSHPRPCVPSAPTHLAQSRPQDTMTQTYRGRDRYLGRHVAFDESIIMSRPTQTPSRLSEADRALLTHQGAFTLPPKSVQDELIAIFMQFGAVWTPIVDPSWLAAEHVSYLLRQSLFLAASRMKKHPGTSNPSADFYRRAKLLFFFGGEQDPLILIACAILLHWYNPVGPETVSTDTSGFWLRTAEAIAFQVGLHKEPAVDNNQRGLRRRLWWTLVLRDCIIAAGVGRPRAINLSDSDVLPPTLRDFDVADQGAQLFLAYVPICQLLGDIVEGCLRRQILPTQQKALENALFRWVKQDFRFLIPNPPTIYSFELRQVLVTYFATLIILDRSPTPDGTPPARSLLASSYIVGIFRIFLEHDELCRLGPAFTFYALCAGLALIPAFRFSALRDLASEETLVLKASLQVLSRQWGSAFGALLALQRLTDDVLMQPIFHEDCPVLGQDMMAFFEGIEPRLCRLSTLMYGDESESMTAPPGAPLPSEAPVGDMSTGGNLAVDLNYQDQFAGDSTLLAGNWEGLGFDWSGSWLLDDNIC